MRWLLAALALLAIGNTDVQKLEQRKPALIFDTEKSPEAVAACLAKQNFGALATIVPEGEERRVMVGADGHIVLMFVIRPTSAGSHVEQHRFIPWGSPAGRVLSCR